jgi:hypothetical protein
MSEKETVKVLTCVGCGAPVVAGAASCNSCGVPIGSVEIPYMPRKESRPEVGPWLKWWGICCALIWVFSGFDLGTTSSLLILGASIFFLLKILRTYFSD